MNPNDPPRLTVGQAIVIGVILLIGLIVLPNRLALVTLVAALGLAAVVLNGLFRLLLRITEPKEDAPDSDG